LKPSGVFIRQGSSSVPASMSAIRNLIKETDGDRYETMRSFDQGLTFKYAQDEFAARGVSLAKSQMITLGLLTSKEDIFTNLALLLSDQCVHTIKVAVFQGNTKEVFKDRREFQGSLLKQLDDSFGYLDLINKTRAEIDGLRRHEMRDYPEVALREALINAIVHREYSASSSTLISVFDDKIEIVSFGGLVKGITLKDVMFGISIARNEKLAAVFYRLKLIEAYGTGISKIVDSYGDYVKKPVFETSDNAFKVVLHNRNSHEINAGLYSEKEVAVMSMIRKKGCICRKDVELLLGISQTMAGRILNSLEQKNAIVRSGKGSKTVYAIKSIIK
jgi:ATP-dependent DNA helicase RecG